MHLKIYNNIQSHPPSQIIEKYIFKLKLIEKDKVILINHLTKTIVFYTLSLQV